MFKFFATIALIQIAGVFGLMPQNLIQDNPIMIFSKTVCPFCIKAKDLLKREGIEYKVVEFDSMPLDEAINLYEELKKMTGQTTVPNIFINNRHIGGFTDLLKFKNENELLNLVDSKDDDIDNLIQKVLKKI